MFKHQCYFCIGSLNYNVSPLLKLNLKKKNVNQF